MANYIVSDTNLTAVANAIRTKGGTSSALEFPDEFIQAIGDIQTGGGVTIEPLNITENGTYTAPTGKAYSPVTVNVSGGGTDTLTALESNTLTSWTSTATKASRYMFYEKSALISVSYPSANSIETNCFYKCTGLTSTNFPNATAVGDYAFYGCNALEEINLEKVAVLGGTAFRGCTKLKDVKLSTDYSGQIQSGTFYGCTALEVFDAKKASTISATVFRDCSNLKTLVLRRTSVCSLSNISAFQNTPFASGKAGGTLYVPQDLIASYQSATNWSTILGYPNNQIKAIEGSIYE